MKIINRFFAFFILTIFFPGCMMPGTMSAEGNLKIIRLNEEGINSPQDRTVILTFWKFPGVNNAPPQIEFDSVFLLNNDRKKLGFSTKFYKIVWTPVLGVQHLSPDPGTVAFADGYWPHIGYDVAPESEKPRVCCSEPLQHIREFALRMTPMIIEAPHFMNSNVKSEYELLIKEKKQVRRNIQNCSELTLEDKEMVLRSLENLESILTMGIL